MVPEFAPGRRVDAALNAAAWDLTTAPAADQPRSPSTPAADWTRLDGAAAPRAPRQRCGAQPASVRTKLSISDAAPRRSPSAAAVGAANARFGATGRHTVARCSSDFRLRAAPTSWANSARHARRSRRRHQDLGRLFTFLLFPKRARAAMAGSDRATDSLALQPGARAGGLQSSRDRWSNASPILAATVARLLRRTFIMKRSNCCSTIRSASSPTPRRAPRLKPLTTTCHLLPGAPLPAAFIAPAGAPRRTMRPYLGNYGVSVGIVFETPAARRCGPHRALLDACSATDACCRLIAMLARGQRQRGIRNRSRATTAAGAQGNKHSAETNEHITRDRAKYRAMPRAPQPNGGRSHPPAHSS